MRKTVLSCSAALSASRLLVGCRGRRMMLDCIWARQWSIPISEAQTQVQRYPAPVSGHQ